MWPFGIIILITIMGSKASAGEKDLYDFLWLDPDKSVYVLQNKIYKKKSSFYLDFGYVTGLSSEFQDSVGGQLRLGHYFQEEWAVELNYTQYTNTDNNAYESVKAVSGTEPFIRRMSRDTSLFLLWSPFYGKINTFNKIYYFDWSFGVGSGETIAESNLKSVRNPTEKNTFKTEKYIPVKLKTNVKFHINKNVHLGLEFNNTNFQAGTPTRPNSNKWEQQNEITFSLGVSF